MNRQRLLRHIIDYLKFTEDYFKKYSKPKYNLFEQNKDSLYDIDLLNEKPKEPTMRLVFNKKKQVWQFVKPNKKP